MSVLIATTLTPELTTGLAAAKTLDGHTDFALIPDDFSGLDAMEFASWLGPVTERLGLIPEVRVTHLEPFHVATASATLDFAARARAGLSIGISDTAAEAKLFGRRDPAPTSAAWAEASAVIGLLRRLWDSWDDDAIIRDQSTDRYIDRDRLHSVEATLKDSTGTDYSVLGPSMTPRPPQGHLPIVVRAEPGNEAARAAADIVLVDEASGTVSLEDLRTELSPATPVLAILPAPDSRTEVVDIVGSVRILHDRGAGGVLFSTAAARQLGFSVRLVSEIIPALETAGLRADTTGAGLRSAELREATTGADLRSRLGVGPAVSLYADA